MLIGLRHGQNLNFFFLTFFASIPLLCFVFFDPVLIS